MTMSTAIAGGPAACAAGMKGAGLGAMGAGVVKGEGSAASGLVAAPELVDELKVAEWKGSSGCPIVASCCKDAARAAPTCACSSESGLPVPAMTW